LKLDIVHTQTEFSLGFIGKFVARNMHIPTVHTYHTMYEDYLHYILNGHLLRPYHVRQMTRTFVHNDAGIVAPSDRVLETLAGYGVTAPIRVIPTGIELGAYKHNNNRDIRAELGLTDVPVLISLSRVAFEKRIDRVIDAMPRILKAVPDAVLLIVGDGPARESLEEQTESLELGEHVRFIGEVNHDEVPLYYRAADIFMSASDSEAQGLTYLEAMAAGTKVLALAGDYTNALLSDPTIGRTFQRTTEMAQLAIEYLQNADKYADPTAREAKLDAISADRFGERVVKFYKDATVYYNETIDDRLTTRSFAKPLNFRRVWGKDEE
jgi:1,2-diacylglycerol 3-alpha-glucosyltransferase